MFAPKYGFLDERKEIPYASLRGLPQTYYKIDPYTSELRRVAPYLTDD